MKIKNVAVAEMPTYRGTKESGVKEVASPFEASVATDAGTLTIRVGTGYRFDGASIPRALWRVCGHPFESPRDAAALIHDWLYGAQPLTRATADEIYRRTLLALGVSAWRARIEYLALRACGWRAWKEVTDTEMIDAVSLGDIVLDGTPFWDSDTV